MRKVLIPFVSAVALMLSVVAPSFGQEWTEFESKEEQFTALFPGKPVVTETPWISQFGAVLPARVYSVTSGPSRYSLTAVDYRPIERIQVERARRCREAAGGGSTFCNANDDWGIGYWKNDIRGAIVYAISKYVQRDVKVTQLMWNGISVVQGQVLQLTNNADKSRTFVGVYMHADRLIIVEATVPGNYPAPVAFTESIGWLNEKGEGVRYRTIYVNAPDVPRPSGR